MNLDIFKIIFDRRHIKDVRIWVLMMLFIGFCCYHKFVIMPINDRIKRVSRREWAHIQATGLEKEVRAIARESGERE